MDRRQALKNVAWAVGGALSASTIAGVLGGCKAGGPSWKPKLVTPEQNALIEILSELIIPATDTPGAMGVKVNQFIDLMLADWMTVGEREHFLKGLADVDAQARKAHQLAFSACTNVQQIEIMKALEADALKAADAQQSDDAALKPFFSHLKELTLIGYYTSETGATQELKYMAAPGQFKACMPFEEIERSWAG